MKELAREKGLLCMGPDCGVANINGAALVLAGLAARGETYVENRHFIERGYEDICRDLSHMGARILKD